jgi:hypothetical protein
MEDLTLHEEWRFNTSKCRGKLQKMGMVYTHSQNFKKKFKNLKKLKETNFAV